MVSQLEVETVEGRDIRPPVRWTWPAAFAAVLSLAGVVALFGSASGAKPSLKGGAGLALSSGPTPAVPPVRVPTTGDIHDAYGNHSKDIDRGADKFKDHGTDPCTLVRYGCMRMDNRTYCEMAGDYCRWMDVPGFKGCVKSDTGATDICAALSKDKCASADQYCTWQDVNPETFEPGGYCLQSKSSDEGCGLNPVKAVCERREQCEWQPDTKMELQRRNLQGLPDAPPGGLPGGVPKHGLGGTCVKRKQMTKDDCCTALGPDEATCDKVRRVCTWDTEASKGHGKCRSNGGVEGGVDNGGKRSKQEICRSIFIEKQCQDLEFMCRWKSSPVGSSGGAGVCEPLET